MATALELKEQGNNAFAAGHFAEANRLYTRAIQRDPVNPAFFTNRAFTRIKLEQWSGCLDDCLKAIDLFPADDKPTSIKMKAYYYLAQAQLELFRPGEALASAMRAYEMSRSLMSSSMEQLSTLVLRAKRARWERMQHERLRRKNELFCEVEEALWKVCRYEEDNGPAEDRMSLDGDSSNDSGELHGEKRPSAAREACERQLRDLREVFGRADPDRVGAREVPDYLIDNITFSIMQDPVITKHGHSYERSTLIAHLRNSETDPLTRDPLTIQDLRPNLALKEASAKFLDENGWAVDW